MGQDKAFLPWQGTTFLQHIIDQVKQLADTFQFEQLVELITSFLKET